MSEGQTSACPQCAKSTWVGSYQFPASWNASNDPLSIKDCFPQFDHEATCVHLVVAERCHPIHWLWQWHGRHRDLPQCSEIFCGQNWQNASFHDGTIDGNDLVSDLRFEIGGIQFVHVLDWPKD